MRLSSQGSQEPLYRGGVHTRVLFNPPAIGLPVGVNKEGGLQTLVQRLRSKAEICRLAVTESEPELRDPRKRRQCTDRANLVGAVCWMLWADPLNARLDVEWLDLGGAMDATADAVETLERIKRSARGTWLQRREALKLLAEAQCMLRIAHERAQTQVFKFLKHGEDPEQRAAYEYARMVARKERCQIDQYLRKNDVAFPEHAQDLRDEISEFREQCEASWRLGVVDWALGGGFLTARQEASQCS